MNLIDRRRPPHPSDRREEDNVTLVDAHRAFVATSLGVMVFIAIVVSFIL